MISWLRLSINIELLPSILVISVGLYLNGITGVKYLWKLADSRTVAILLRT